MKKKMLFIIPISIIIVACTVVGILYFATDLFKPTSKLFWKYFSQNSSMINNLSKDKLFMQSEFKKNNSYITNGELSLLVKQGENSSKQLNLTTIAKHNSNNDRTFAEATLKNGDLNIFNVSYANNGDIYAIKCDEVTPNYVGIQNKELKKMAVNYGLNYADIIPNEISFSAYTNRLNLTEEQNKYISNTYFPILTDKISENNYTKSKEKIEIDGTVYDANAYNVKISGEDAKQIIIDILNMIKTDEEMINIITNYIDTTNFGTKVDEMISKIEKNDINDDIDIKVYEAKGNTIKTLLSISEIAEIILERNNNKIKLTVNLNDEFIGTNNKDDSDNEIIDLNEYELNKEELNTKIVFTKEKSDNKEIYKANIIPNINNEENNIYLEAQFSNIQNNSFNNLYILTINKNEEEKEKSTTITYKTNTTKTNEVGEIVELTNENTIIANNYDKNQFKPFINSWIQIFKDKLKEKLETIGFEY